EAGPGRLVDGLRGPLVALPHYFGAQIPYDPRSRGLPFGPAGTVVRGSLVRLLRWWLLSALERQDHVNRLLVRAIEQLDERSPRVLDERLTAIEESWRARDSAERAELLESTALAQAFASTDRFQAAAPAPLVELLRARTRLLVSDLSWPGLANAPREPGAAYQGVDPDAASVARSRAAGDDAVQRNTDVQLRAL